MEWLLIFIQQRLQQSIREHGGGKLAEEARQLRPGRLGSVQKYEKQGDMTNQFHYTHAKHIRRNDSGKRRKMRYFGEQRGGLRQESV
jgi:hypothetical protein